MEKYNYAIQVADNVTDIMNLPCVMRCDKLVIGAGGIYDFAEGIEDEGGIENFVEYVPFDAFIEKACKFIETYPHLFMGVLRSEVIEDFKNYMK